LKRHSYMFSFIHSSMALHTIVGPRPLFGFVILYSVGRAPWTGDQHVASLLPTQDKQTQTAMPTVGFEPATLVLERTKTVRASKSAAIAFV
jgi:hypothetical protein